MLFNDKMRINHFFNGTVMPKFIRKSTVTTVICYLAYAVLAGCGTKGPLYIPEQRYPQKDSEQEAQTTNPKNNPEATTPTKEY
jgi:predicted small lipoprotein YifL